MELVDLSLLLVLVMLLSAFLAAILHGATGLAGGVVLVAILSHLVGVKLAIPIVTCSLVFSHASRAWLYYQYVDWRSVAIVLLFSVPTIAVGAVVFTTLSETRVALMMACFLSLSLPVKAWAKRRNRQTGDVLLAGASFGWGFLAGNVVGPGFVLAPFLQGRGMGRMAFVGSLACIVLVMNIAKIMVFESTALLGGASLALGIVLGLVTIPGNWLGKQLLSRLSDPQHGRIINIMTIGLIINFLALAMHDTF